MLPRLSRIRVSQHPRKIKNHHGSQSPILSSALPCRRPCRNFASTTGGGDDSNLQGGPSILKRVWRSITNPESDDAAGELKTQERKDLYYLLLVTKLRQVRVEQPNLEYKEAFETAYNELESKGLDDMSNAMLRLEMQDLLGPQVLELFDCFDHVDSQMNPQIFQDPDAVDAAGIGSDIDYNEYKSVVTEDYEATATRLEKLRNSQENNASASTTDPITSKLAKSISFLERKLGALTSIMEFHSWTEGGGGDWATTLATDFDGEMDDFGFRISTADEQTFIAIRQYQTINMFRAAMLRKELGYSVLALKSLLPGAGRGVFVDGVARSGSLMAFQPGPVWPLGSVRPDVEDHFADNHNLQLSMRYDNFIVDSRRSPYTVLTRPNSNPFALGHVVNHPQQGSLPNCQSVMLNFVEGMDLGEMFRYVPNTYAVPPAWINRTFDRYVIEMHGLCLLARRDLQEEEMFYDYRITGTDMPRWYHKVDYPED